MRFKEFLLLKEAATEMTASDAETIYETIETHCSDALAAARSGKVLFRGVSSSEPFVIGSGGDRSVHHEFRGARMYRLWDSLPSWIHAPSRLSCYICSTHKVTASTFSDEGGNVYALFPFNGNKMGVCPTADFNRSFTKRIKELTGRSFTVQSLASLFGTVGKALNTSFSEGDLKDIKKFLTDITPKKLEVIPSGAIFLTLMTDLHRGNVFDALNVALDPKLNGFKFIDSAQSLPTGDHEVWVTGKCIMVKLDKLTTNDEVRDLWKKLKINPKVMT